MDPVPRGARPDRRQIEREASGPLRGRRPGEGGDVSPPSRECGCGNRCPSRNAGLSSRMLFLGGQPLRHAHGPPALLVLFPVLLGPFALDRGGRGPGSSSWVGGGSGCVFLGGLSVFGHEGILTFFYLRGRYKTASGAQEFTIATQQASNFSPHSKRGESAVRCALSFD